MGTGYLIDTNVVIAHLGNLLPTNGAAFVDAPAPQISVISRIELLGWYNAPATELAKLEQFVNNAFIFELEEPLILRTIELRQQHRIKTPDAIIAATALHYNLQLLTRNFGDFKHINGLNTLNPFDL